jgi:predicted DCC family thiol-disulfide oxidoreductase YuxK
MIPIDMARDATEDAGDWTVLYDADCGFCRWALARVLALDRNRRLRPLALGTPTANALLADLTPEQRAASWHLVAPDGRRWSAGAAAPPLLRLLPGGGGAAWALAAAPALTERAYRWVAEHRSLLGRAIPDSAKDRATERIDRHQPRLDPAP